MIDFHSHIIFGVDDGAKKMEQSIELLKEAEKAGYTDIIVTPHYKKNRFEINKSEVAEKIHILNNVIKENEININIHQGNEIYFAEDIVELINGGIVSTMGNSNYVLFELPWTVEPMNLQEVIFSLIENVKIPVIAHPERYEYFQNDINKVYNLMMQGVLFQINLGSISGQYGRHAKKTVKKLLKNNLVHFIGTDVHRPNTTYKNVKKSIRKLKKIISEDKIIELTYSNPKKIIDNEYILN